MLKWLKAAERHYTWSYTLELNCVSSINMTLSTTHQIRQNGTSNYWHSKNLYCTVSGKAMLIQ